MTDPWIERLSEYLDGELEPEETRDLWRHLLECDECPRVLDDLRRIVAQAHTLADRPPKRDLWPVIAERTGLDSNRTSPDLSSGNPLGGVVRRSPWLLAFVAAAAGILLGLGSSYLVGGGDSAGSVQVAGGARWLLLLREPEEMMVDASPSEVASAVAKYASWAQGLAVSGHLLSGEKLADDRGWIHRPGSGGADAFSPLEGAIGSPERVAGFFLIEAEDSEEANRIAGECPHLSQGGWVELRRIEEL